MEVTYLLTLSGVLALQTSPHGPRTEASRSDIQALGVHSIKHKLIAMSAESKTTLNHIISKLIEKQWWREWFQGCCDDADLVGGFGAVDDLLDDPCSIFVNADGGHVWSYFFRNSKTGSVVSAFYNFLEDDVANVVCIFMAVSFGVDSFERIVLYQ